MQLRLIIQYGDWFLLKQMAKNVEEDTFEDFLVLLCQDAKFRVGAGTNKPSDWFKTVRRRGQAEVPAKIGLKADSANTSSVSNPSLNTQETGFSEDNNNRAEMK